MTDSPRDITELMSGYMDGQLSAKEHALAEVALQTDVTAAKVLAELQLLRSGIRALGEQPSDLSPIPSLADRVLAQLEAPDSENANVVSASQQAKLSETKSSARRWSTYISMAIALIAVAAIWQVMRVQQDHEGHSIVNVNQEPEASGDESLFDGNTENPEKIEQQEIEQQDEANNSTLLVDNDDSRKGPMNPDLKVVEPNSPEQPKPSELASVVETPGGNGLDGQPDLSVLTNGKFLFVIEVGVTPEGRAADVVRDVLMKNGIVYDGGLDVMPELEEQLLNSRFLNGVVQNEKQPVGGTVDLIYLVASGLQIDQTRLDIHSRHGHIARYRFNMALLPKDVGVFDNLHRAVKSQWASDESASDTNDKVAYQKQLQKWKGKAGQLMTTLYFLAGKGSAVSKVGIEIPTLPIPPKGANRGNLKEPTPTDKPILGADLICEVLLVVRNITLAELESLPETKK